MQTELAIQFDLLAQGPRFEDWGDFLIIAIMAILWLVGALAKAIGGRKGAQQRQQEGSTQPQRRPRETWHARLARKAEEMQRAAEGKSRQVEQEARTRHVGSRPRPTRTPSQPPSPPAGKLTVRTGQKGESVMVYEHPSSQGATDREQQVARRQDAREAVGAAEPTGPWPEAARQHADFEPAVLIDYEDPDALKKAVLHYEILGKPLGLREPSEENSLF